MERGKVEKVKLALVSTELRANCRTSTQEVLLLLSLSERLDGQGLFAHPWLHAAYALGALGLKVNTRPARSRILMLKSSRKRFGWNIVSPLRERPHSMLV